MCVCIHASMFNESRNSICCMNRYHYKFRRHFVNNSELLSWFIDQLISRVDCGECQIQQVRTYVYIDVHHVAI